MTGYKLSTLGALNGAIAILTSAFGAHALKAKLLAGTITESQYSSFTTGADIHLPHAIVLVLIGFCHTHKMINLHKVFWLFQIGIGSFSGSLYWYGLGGPKQLVLATPIGGILLIAGWITMAVVFWRHSQADA